MRLTRPGAAPSSVGVVSNDSTNSCSRSRFTGPVYAKPFSPGYAGLFRNRVEVEHEADIGVGERELHAVLGDGFT